ncbi:hypothetical protein [uncultured Leifsonia sp.]|uniref:hypothetical protein n=1 Tax=uncultured Leifsonia sp. TaxID=340359 RepID=UPI0025CEFE63|nr:hypothetical protein [uncultured Leifsonia sp.]
MNEHPGSASLEGVGVLTARATVQHTGGWTWESRWLLVTKYLARLQEIYSGAPIESNTDLWAITNSFMIDGYHLGEAFTHQLSLREQVAMTVANSPELQLCRDYANTWKHFNRNSNARVAYIWADGDSESGGHFVTIAYRLRDDPQSSQTVVDALAVARAAWEAWRAFMSSNGLAEPTGLTQPYLDTIMGKTPPG